MDLGNFAALFIGGLVMILLRLGDIAVKYTAKRLGVTEQEGSAKSIADTTVQVAEQLKG